MHYYTSVNSGNNNKDNNNNNNEPNRNNITKNKGKGMNYIIYNKNDKKVINQQQ